MKNVILTALAALVLVGCGETVVRYSDTAPTYSTYRYYGEPGFYDPDVTVVYYGGQRHYVRRHHHHHHGMGH